MAASKLWAVLLSERKGRVEVQRPASCQGAALPEKWLILMTLRAELTFESLDDGDDAAHAIIDPVPPPFRQLPPVGAYVTS